MCTDAQHDFPVSHAANEHPSYMEEMTVVQQIEGGCLLRISHYLCTVIILQAALLLIRLKEPPAPGGLHYHDGLPCAVHSQQPTMTLPTLNTNMPIKLSLSEIPPTHIPGSNTDTPERHLLDASTGQHSSAGKNDQPSARTQKRTMPRPTNLP